MSLRSSPQTYDLEILPILLVVLVVLGILAILMLRRKTEVVVFASQCSQQDSVDSINIRIQFTPTYPLVQRRRAPSTIDLGPSAATVAAIPKAPRYMKKEV